MTTLEYRIVWREGGPGEWTPIQHAFDHRRRAREAVGSEPDGLAVIWVADADNIEFRWTW